MKVLLQTKFIVLDHDNIVAKALRFSVEPQKY